MRPRMMFGTTLNSLEIRCMIGSLTSFCGKLILKSLDRLDSRALTGLCLPPPGKRCQAHSSVHPDAPVGAVAVVMMMMVVVGGIAEAEPDRGVDGIVAVIVRIRPVDDDLLRRRLLPDRLDHLLEEGVGRAGLLEGGHGVRV